DHIGGEDCGEAPLDAGFGHAMHLPLEDAAPPIVLARPGGVYRGRLPLGVTRARQRDRHRHVASSSVQSPAPWTAHSEVRSLFVTIVALTPTLAILPPLGDDRPARVIMGTSVVTSSGSPRCTRRPRLAAARLPHAVGEGRWGPIHRPGVAPASPCGRSRNVHIMRV